MMELREYQRHCVDYHLTHHYTINACEMGLGKSAMALNAAKKAGMTPLIFGPAFLKANWKNECAMWACENVRYVAHSRVHKYAADQVKSFNFWIVDEAHFFKTPNSRRSVAFYNLLEKVRPAYLILMTGTPIKNRVPDLWMLLALCNLCPETTNGKKLEGSLKRYYGFADHFCIKEEFGGRFRHTKYIGLKPGKAEELKAMLDKKYIRFRSDEVLKELPKLSDIFHRISLDPVPGLKDEFEKYMAGTKTDVVAKTLIGRLSAKQTAEYCASILDAGNRPLLIFSDHLAAVADIADFLKGMKFIIETVTGSVPGDKRSTFVDKFQANKLHAIVATIETLGTGVNLTAAHHVVFNDFNWTPAANWQAVKRLHRIGQNKPVFVHWIIASKTHEYIWKTLMDKQKTIDAVI